MQKLLIIAAAAATVTLGACNSEPESVNRYDAQAKAYRFVFSGLRTG